MAETDFDDLVETRERETASTEERSVALQVIGSAITAQEIKDRLSSQLYTQLTSDDDAVTTRAAQRAVIHVGTIAARLGKVCNLDDQVIREIVQQWTIYEMHMALGHAEEGKEARLKAKDLIIATFGAYPDNEKETSAPAQVAAVTTEPRKHFP